MVGIPIMRQTKKGELHCIMLMGRMAEMFIQADKLPSNEEMAFLRRDVEPTARDLGHMAHSCDCSLSVEVAYRGYETEGEAGDG